MTTRIGLVVHLFDGRPLVELYRRYLSMMVVEQSPPPLICLVVSSDGDTIEPLADYEPQRALYECCLPQCGQVRSAVMQRLLVDYAGKVDQWLWLRHGQWMRPSARRFLSCVRERHRDTSLLMCHVMYLASGCCYTECVGGQKAKDFTGFFVDSTEGDVNGAATVSHLGGDVWLDCDAADDDDVVREDSWMLRDRVAALVARLTNPLQARQLVIEYAVFLLNYRAEMAESVIWFQFALTDVAVPHHATTLTQKHQAIVQKTLGRGPFTGDQIDMITFTAVVHTAYLIYRFADRLHTFFRGGRLTTLTVADLVHVCQVDERPNQVEHLYLLGKLSTCSRDNRTPAAVTHRQALSKLRQMPTFAGDDAGQWHLVFHMPYLWVNRFGDDELKKRVVVLAETILDETLACRPMLRGSWVGPQQQHLTALCDALECLQGAVGPQVALRSLVEHTCHLIEDENVD